MSRSARREKEPSVGVYARSVLREMLAAVADSPDLSDALAGAGVDGETLGCLVPAVVGLLGLGIGMAAQARTGTGPGLAGLEQELQVDGRDVLCLLAQGVSDLAGRSEVRRSGGVLGSDGVWRTRVESGHARGVGTVVGRITVSRLAYRAAGVGNLHPADEVLGLPSGLYSPGLACLCAREAVRGSFVQAADAVERATGVRIGTRQVIGLVRDAAGDAAEFHADRSVPAVSDGDVLVLTGDGKGVPVLPAALRPDAARAAAKAAAGRGPRKRMAELVAVYTVHPVPRTVDDVVPPADPSAGQFGEQSLEKAVTAKGPSAADTWLTASLIEDIPTVIATGFDEAERRDPGHQHPWVALVDGNATQIDAINAEAARRGVTVPILIDYIHVTGYLWDAAKAFFCTDTRAGMVLARRWVAERTRLILAGGALAVASRISARARDSKLSATQRKTVDEAVTYLTNKAPYLDYPTALAAGWPIATGVIEGSCRYLVADRMDITGARWGLDTAEAVLTLRALHASGLFDDYWQYHQQCDQLRTHSGLAHQHDYTLAA